MSSPERLVHMANQIGSFFKSQGEGNAVPGIAITSRNSGTLACALLSSHIWIKAEQGWTRTSRMR